MAINLKGPSTKNMNGIELIMNRYLILPILNELNILSDVTKKNMRNEKKKNNR